MKLKRLKKIKINNITFKVVYDKTHDGGWFSFAENIINIGTRSKNEEHIFDIICHETMEIIMEDISVRYHRPDVDSDYLFALDHRQFNTAILIFSGVISQFIN